MVDQYPGCVVTDVNDDSVGPNFPLKSRQMPSAPETIDENFGNCASARRGYLSHTAGTRLRLACFGGLNLMFYEL